MCSMVKYYETNLVSNCSCNSYGRKIFYCAYFSVYLWLLELQIPYAKRGKLNKGFIVSKIIFQIQQDSETKIIPLGFSTHFHKSDSLSSTSEFLIISILQRATTMLVKKVGDDLPDLKGDMLVMTFICWWPIWDASAPLFVLKKSPIVT